MKKVMVAGTFDIIHPGHLHFFEQAKAHGDHLSVVVSHDCREKEGRRHSQQERVWAVSVLSMVDETIKGGDGEMFNMLKQVQPHVLCLGYDQNVNEEALHSFIAQHSLDTKVVRCTAHMPELFKSSLLR